MQLSAVIFFFYSKFTQLILVPVQEEIGFALIPILDPESGVTSVTEDNLRFVIDLFLLRLTLNYFQRFLQATS